MKRYLEAKFKIGDSVIIPKGVKSLPDGDESDVTVIFDKDTPGVVYNIYDKNSKVVVNTPEYYHFLTYYASNIRVAEN
jgi:hypothetical protein